MATEPSTPLVSKLQLGFALRDLREAAGISRDKAAEALQCGVAKISKVETGKAALTHAEVWMLLGVYNVTDDAERAKVERLGRDARRRAPHRVPDWAKTYIAMEANAAEIRSYDTELVPGLLQTDRYAREMLRVGSFGGDPREVERQVAARAERRDRLIAEDGPLIWAILSEGAIHRQVGGEEVLREQLDLLLEVGSHSNVTIQVLPFTRGAHPAMGSTFRYLQLRSPADGVIVYLEDLTSADYQDRPSHVAEYRRVFDHLAMVAADPEQSARMLESAHERMGT